MRKRQRKKIMKAWAVSVQEDSHLFCGECNKKLKPWSDEYQLKYGTCDSYCYGKMVGVYA